MNRVLSKTKTIAAAGIVSLGVLLVFASAEKALAGVARGEAAFKKGNFVTALREFEGPAYRGDGLAQYYLGVIYAEGLGVSQNQEEGLAWMICVGKNAGLPPSIGREMQRKQANLLSRISPYSLEQAQMRAESICGVPTETRPEPYAEKKRDPEDIRPTRGFWGGLFFFPGDTMVTGAAVVFHELGLTFLTDVLFGLSDLFGDFVYGILSLIGWFLIGRIILFFGQPLWLMALGRNGAAHDAGGGGNTAGRAQESERT